jgi:peptide deformylase
MEILKFPDKRLFTKCQAVTVFGEELKVILEHMWNSMVGAKGIGLASNQVGLELYMFTMEGPEEEKLFIINPKVVSRSQAPANIREGCLSAPGEFLVRPDRALWVEVEFQDENGKITRRVFKNLHAVCVEHEIEHLEGKGFMQSKSLPKKVRADLAKKWKL